MDDLLKGFYDFINQIVDFFKDLVKSIRKFNDTTHIS